MERERRSGKPFIKLFCTPNGYYCFDVNMNEMVEVSIDEFQYLKQSLNGEIQGYKMPVTLVQMKKEGYFAEISNVQYIKHALTDYLYDFLDRRLLKLTLQVTQDCNFRCKYCIYSEEHNVMQRTHSCQNMDWNTAKSAVDFLWEHSADSKRVNIGFYGGEPLLQMELIKKVVAYSEEIFEGKQLSFNITTNGTLLDAEKIKYFDKHKISLMISLDGPKEINDRNRVFRNGQGTFDTVMEKIRLVKTVSPEYAKRLQISMVIDPENDFDCINEIYIDETDFRELVTSASVVVPDGSQAFLL